MARPKKVQNTTITWLGEDDLHENGAGPSKTVWNGIAFPKGVPVEVNIPHMIAKAKTNRFFEVAGERPEAAPEEEPKADDLPVE